MFKSGMQEIVERGVFESKKLCYLNNSTSLQRQMKLQCLAVGIDTQIYILDLNFSFRPNIMYPG